jgi:hypothetical protein
MIRLGEISFGRITAQQSDGFEREKKKRKEKQHGLLLGRSQGGEERKQQARRIGLFKARAQTER